MAKPIAFRTHKDIVCRSALAEGRLLPEAEIRVHLLAAAPKDRTETFLTLSAEQVLGRSGGPALPIADMLSDRMVLIGGNFSDRDQHLIPLSVTDGRRYPGLFVHAQILAQIMDERSLSTLSKPLQFVVLRWPPRSASGSAAGRP